MHQLFLYILYASSDVNIKKLLEHIFQFLINSIIYCILFVKILRMLCIRKKNPYCQQYIHKHNGYSFLTVVLNAPDVDINGEYSVTLRVVSLVTLLYVYNMGLARTIVPR